MLLSSTWEELSLCTLYTCFIIPPAAGSDADVCIYSETAALSHSGLSTWPNWLILVWNATHELTEQKIPKPKQTKWLLLGTSCHMQAGLTWSVELSAWWRIAHNRYSRWRVSSRFGTVRSVLVALRSDLSATFRQAIWKGGKTSGGKRQRCDSKPNSCCVAQV